MFEFVKKTSSNAHTYSISKSKFMWWKPSFRHHVMMWLARNNRKMCISNMISGRKWFSSPENTEDCHLMLPIRLVFCQSHLLNQSPVLGDRICDPDHHHQVQKKKFLDDSRHCDLKHGKKGSSLSMFMFCDVFL